MDRLSQKLLECVIYLRLSKEDIGKKDESSSITSQRMIIEAFCKFNNFNIVEEYVDDGYSGGNFNRPAFSRMIEDIESGRVKCVITKDLSRLGREMYGTGGYIEEYFLEKGVRYIAINDSFDSESGDYSMLGIRLGVNDLYLRDVSKKVRNTLKIKQETGDYIGSFPCYGYLKDPNDHHHLIIDKEVEHIVKLIYSMALEGYGMNSISNRLTSMQIPIPVVYKGEKRGKMITENDGFGIWKHSTIKNILTSEMYIGNMVQHTYYKTSYRSKKIKKVDENDKIIVKNTHEAIISEEDFRKVQEILKGRSTYTIKKEAKYVFTGLLKCKECGATLSISEKVTKKNNSHFTQCNLYRKKGKYGACTQHRLNYNYLEEDVLNIIRNICTEFLNGYDFNKIVQKKNELYNDNYISLKKEISKLDGEIQKSNIIIDNLYRDKISKIISVDDFTRIYESEKSKNESLKNRKVEIKNKLDEIDNEMANNNYDDCVSLIKEFMSMKKPSRNMMCRLIDKIEISENKEVDIYFKFKELSLVSN